MGVYRSSEGGGKPKLVVPKKEAAATQAINAANKARDVYKQELDKLEAFLLESFQDRVEGSETAVDMAIRIMTEDKAKLGDSEMVEVDTDVEAPAIPTLGSTASVSQEDTQTEESDGAETETDPDEEESVDPEVLDEERG